mmetsp:Transcript_4139/g.6157  ORF Transcript_4139/g.6157 Transcript_4139/m.6157 type:complete len:86 (-) Transcript_4139:657-914(-)
MVHKTAQPQLNFVKQFLITPESSLSQVSSKDRQASLKKYFKDIDSEEFDSEPTLTTDESDFDHNALNMDPEGFIKEEQYIQEEEE